MEPNGELPDVIESCRRVVDTARHLEVDEAALEACAAQIRDLEIPAPAHPEELRFYGTREDVARFVLLSDCLNFCFWSDQPWVVTYLGKAWTRTFAMLAGLARTVQADATWLQPQRWAAAGEREVAELFAGVGGIPLLRERVAVLRETGAVLLAKYDGEFVHLLEEAGGDAPEIARLLAQHFPSFRDVAEYDGEPVAFLKRAQICVADLAAQWSSEGHGTLERLDRLTVFADYRLPQLFRHWGVLRVDEALAERIEAHEEIPAGSAEEVELRAATIGIGDWLSWAIEVPAWRLDYYLWERSHDPEVTVAHHRTRTVFY